MPLHRIGGDDLLHEQDSGVRKKGMHTKMRVKLAAKLLVIASTLIKKKKPFNPAYLKAA